MGKEVTGTSTNQERDFVTTHVPNGKNDQISHKPPIVAVSGHATDNRDGANSTRNGNLSFDQDTPERKYDEQNSFNQKTAESDSANAAVQPNHNVPQTVPSANEKPTSCENHVFVAGVAANGDKHPNVNALSPNIQKKDQVCYKLLFMSDPSLTATISFPIMAFQKFSLDNHPLKTMLVQYVGAGNTR